MDYYAFRNGQVSHWHSQLNRCKGESFKTPQLRGSAMRDKCLWARGERRRAQSPSPGESGGSY